MQHTSVSIVLGQAFYIVEDELTFIHVVDGYGGVDVTNEDPGRQPAAHHPLHVFQANRSLLQLDSVDGSVAGVSRGVEQQAEDRMEEGKGEEGVYIPLARSIKTVYPSIY